MFFNNFLNFFYYLGFTRRIFSCIAQHSCTAAADSAVILLELDVQWELAGTVLVSGGDRGESRADQGSVQQQRAYGV